eukprot:Gb_41650 [translate_table: standard]
MNGENKKHESQLGDTTLTKVFMDGLSWETQRETMRRYFGYFGEFLEDMVTFCDPEVTMRAYIDPSPVIDGRRANCNIASLGHPRPSPPPALWIGSSGQGMFPPLCQTSPFRKCGGREFSINTIPKKKPMCSRGIQIPFRVTPGTRMQLEPLDLTEDNVKQVLIDARVFGCHGFDVLTDVVTYQFTQLFDSSVGITGVAELADIDGPFVKLSLKGRFWHKRSTVLARLATYLQKRIPEILEVDIEDEAQLDDSPENF